MAAGEGGAQPPRWDIAGMVAVRCNVAAVAADPEGVALHFGHKAARQDGATAVEHLHKVKLSPYSAKRLQELLAALLQAHDRGR